MSKSKLLFVDDDLMALNYINLLLRSLYDVDTAISATVALELINKNQYNALMLDINLGSGLDGIELLKEIRQFENYKNVPSVAITAYASNSDRLEFLSKGFTHYISKPFSKKELFSLLKEVLSN